MKKTILPALILLIGGLANARIIDKYGFRVGAGYSNNVNINTRKLDPEINIWNYPKLSFNFYLNAEKKLTNFLFIRPEIGYIQKGFVSDYVINLTDGNKLKIEDDKVVLDDLSLDLAFKVKPFAKNSWPYFILGFRGDYMLNNRSAIVKYNGTIYQQYKYEVDNINSLTIGGLIGIGFEFREIIYFDVEFNPSISKNHVDPENYIIDRYTGISLGVNINGLIKND